MHFSWNKYKYCLSVRINKRNQFGEVHNLNTCMQFVSDIIIIVWQFIWRFLHDKMIESALQVCYKIQLQLYKKLMTRWYKTDTIDNAFGKATQHTQKQLLYNDKPNKTETRLTLSIPFSTDTTHIGQIRQKHWHLIESDPTLKILWPNIPMVAYKRNKNIKEML